MSTVGWRDIPVIARVARWLQAFVGSRLTYVPGVISDALIDIATAGVQARFPRTAQPDALAYIGRDRGLDRGATETAAAFALRCQQAFDTYATDGHPRELLTSLLALLAPSTPDVRTVTDLAIWDTVSAGAWTKLYVSPNNWNWDSATKWFRAWALIYAPPFTSTRKWGDGGKWGDRVGTWGSSASSSQVQSLRNVVQKWKPGNENVVSVALVFDTTWLLPSLASGSPRLPDGHWGRRYKSVAGVATASRPTCSTICFLQGAR